MTLVEDPTFPVSPEELTADWVSDVLHRSGAVDRARLITLHHERIGEASDSSGSSRA